MESSKKHFHQPTVYKHQVPLSARRTGAQGAPLSLRKMQSLINLALLAWQLVSAPFGAVSTALVPYSGGALAPAGGALVVFGPLGQPLWAGLLVAFPLLLLCCCSSGPRKQTQAEADTALAAELHKQDLEKQAQTEADTARAMAEQMKTFYHRQRSAATKVAGLEADNERLDTEIAALESLAEYLGETYDAEYARKVGLQDKYPRIEWYAGPDGDKIRSEFQETDCKLFSIQESQSDCTRQRGEKRRLMAHNREMIELLREEAACCSYFIVLAESSANLAHKEVALNKCIETHENIRSRMDALDELFSQ